MSTAIYEVGADFGNWGSKAVRYNHEDTDITTTVIRNAALQYDGSDDVLHDLGLFGGLFEGTTTQRGDPATDSVRFIMDDKQWVVGEAAYDLGLTRDGATTFSRYGTEEWYALVAATFIKLYSKRSGAIALTYSLPVTAFRQGLHEKVTEWLLQPFQVVLDGKLLTYEVLPDMINGIPEGFGSLCYQCLSESGKRFSDRDLAGARVAVLDFGGFTFDITTYDALSVGPVNDSFSSGLIHVRKRVNQALKKRFGRDTDISSKDLDRTIRTKRYGQSGYAEEDVSDIVDAALAELMKVALDKWSIDLGNGYDLDAVIISGGGGPVIGPLLKPRLNHGNIIIIPEGQAHLANAIGSLRHRRFMRLTA